MLNVLEKVYENPDLAAIYNGLIEPTGVEIIDSHKWFVRIGFETIKGPIYVGVRIPKAAEQIDGYIGLALCTYRDMIDLFHWLHTIRFETGMMLMSWAAEPHHKLQNYSPRYCGLDLGSIKDPDIISLGKGYLISDQLFRKLRLWHRGSSPYHFHKCYLVVGGTT